MHRSHPHLYEINTVPWLFELSQRQGSEVRLGRVAPSEWDALKELGFDLVWLMGVWRKSPAGRLMAQQDKTLHSSFSASLPDWTPEDVIGSPYSIHSYEPDHRVGTWSDLDRARRQLEARGMGLVLDFVPNHTGTDHPWVSRHPGYYIQSEPLPTRPSHFLTVERRGRKLHLARGRDPNFEPWQDTAQLNLFNSRTRAALLKTLRKISGYCDGLRCDMAMLVLNDIFARTWRKQLDGFDVPEREFWAEALESFPDLIWIAEAYWDTEWTLQQLGFDYVYDKRLYDRARFSSAPDIRLHLEAEPDYQRRLARFIENHDEPRSAAEFERGRLFAAATLIGTLPGMKLYHHGQLQGRRIRTPVQLLRTPPETNDIELEGFYRRLLKATRHACFHEGRWRLLRVNPRRDESAQNLIAYSWELDSQLRLIVVNFSSTPSQGSVVLAHLDPAARYRLRDLLTGNEYLREGSSMTEEGLEIWLDGSASHLLEFNREN